LLLPGIDPQRLYRQEVKTPLTGLVEAPGKKRGGERGEQLRPGRGVQNSLGNCPRYKGGKKEEVRKVFTKKGFK